MFVQSRDCWAQFPAKTTVGHVEEHELLEILFCWPTPVGSVPQAVRHNPQTKGFITIARLKALGLHEDHIDDAFKMTWFKSLLNGIIQHCHIFFLFNQHLYWLSSTDTLLLPPSNNTCFHTMPPKKTVPAGAGKNPPAAKRQRTLTNKQQQLSKTPSEFRCLTNLCISCQEIWQGGVRKTTSTHGCCLCRAASGRA